MQQLLLFVKTLMGKSIFLTLAMLALVACATAPVQEMSDARQAIRSAEAAGAAQRSLTTLQEAQHSLQAAQTQLETGAYENARRYALDARDKAIKAREQAIQSSAPGPTPP